MDGFEYKNGILEKIHHSEGYVERKADGAFQYNYTLKDHLGNTRVTFADLNNNGLIDPNTEINQINHYAPFEMNLEGNWNGASADAKNKMQYNEKELVTDFGLNWNDYGARNYDAERLQWTTIDPLADTYKRWSPYNYCKDNPIKFIDPDGMGVETKVVNLATGKIIFDDGKIDGNTYVVNDPHFDDTQKFKDLDAVKNQYGGELKELFTSSEEEYSKAIAHEGKDFSKDLVVKYIESQMQAIGLGRANVSTISQIENKETRASKFFITYEDGRNANTGKPTAILQYGALAGLANPLVIREYLFHEAKHIKDISTGQIDRYSDALAMERPAYQLQFNRYVALHYNYKNGSPTDLPRWYQDRLILAASKVGLKLTLPGN